MARTISLNDAQNMGGAISNVQLNSACVVTITDVEERSNAKTGKPFFLCTTDAEVMGSNMRVVLNPIGSKIATISHTESPAAGDEVVCWVTYGEPVDGKQYMTLYPKGHPQFGARRGLSLGGSETTA